MQPIGVTRAATFIRWSSSPTRSGRTRAIPRKLLHLETLTEWLAEKVGLPYLHIDPFKIDFAAVTKVMSNAYAQRYKILPVGVTSKEATIAVCEPHVREWEEQLKQVLRLDIKRVIANPLDIQSYLVEFYNLARSVKGATEKDKGAYSEIANFEQLVQLGRSGRLDANDQHIVHICDWLFNYAFEQRASDIHISSRGARSATCASASTACCTRSTRSRRR